MNNLDQARIVAAAAAHMDDTKRPGDTEARAHVDKLYRVVYELAGSQAHIIFDNDDAEEAAQCEAVLRLMPGAACEY